MVRRYIWLQVRTVLLSRVDRDQAPTAKQGRHAISGVLHTPRITVNVHNSPWMHDITADTRGRLISNLTARLNIESMGVCSFFFVRTTQVFNLDAGVRQPGRAAQNARESIRHNQEIVYCGGAVQSRQPWGAILAAQKLYVLLLLLFE